MSESRVRRHAASVAVREVLVHLWFTGNVSNTQMREALAAAAKVQYPVREGDRERWQDEVWMHIDNDIADRLNAGRKR